MKIAVIISEKDLASLNIGESLKEKFEGKNEFSIKNHEIELHYIPNESIYTDDLDKEIDADLFVFASRHTSSAKIHSLTVHCPGNFGEAKLGGKGNQLGVAPSNIMKSALIELNALAKETDYEIINESTHHGPYLEKPCFYIEIGSDEEHWQDKEAGKIIAKTLINTFSKDFPESKVALGIGGIHSCPTFTRINLESEYSVGHVCAKYNLKDLDEEMIKQAITKSEPKAELVLLDWKGLGQEKERIIKILDKNKIEYKKTKGI